MPCRVVIGNEAGDADSIISSLCYAWLLHSAASSAPSSSTTLTTVPVASIPRADLRLRPETSRLLELAGVDQGLLPCLDQVDLASAAQELVLVDHNAVSASWDASLGPRVVEIVDHHSDLGQHPTVPAEKRTIAFDHETGTATAGSCCTLVAEAFLTRQRIALDQGVALLLAGVMLLDTVNMSATAGKGTARDAAVLDELLPIAATDREVLFHELMTAKFDAAWWRSLSDVQYLRYDYKQAGPLGISAVLLPLTEVAAQSHILAATKGDW